MKFLKENSGWGLKLKFSSRLNIYSTILEYLSDEYDFFDVGICKEDKKMFYPLESFGLDPENMKCNCTW